MDEIAIRVPMIVKPDGYSAYKNHATGRKYYRARVKIGVVGGYARTLRTRCKSATVAQKYGRAVCRRYYRLWRAEATI